MTPLDLYTKREFTKESTYKSKGAGRNYEGLLDVFALISSFGSSWPLEAEKWAARANPSFSTEPELHSPQQPRGEMGTAVLSSK